LGDRAVAVVDNLKTDLLLLNQESEDALDSFRRTVNRIDSINEQIKDRKILAQKQISELTQLVDSFDKAENSNNKVKGKILEFLS